MKKGRSVFIEGRLRTRRWQDKDGREQYSTEIVASDMQMLGSKPDDAKRAPSAGEPSLPPSPPNDDDIPF